jgi:hypothetical protein
MADFDPPFSSVGGANRSPTTDEQADGFSCGSADLTLFNRLFGRIEAELKAIQDEGGVAGTEEDDTTVLQAIQAMIAAATGGGDTSQFVLFSQAQARLPIFPEVTTNNGVIAVTSPGTGQARVPANAVILHRGIRTYTTVQVDFNTEVSKTYHLRWSPTGGANGTFVLKDIADVSYNPTVAIESNSAFDSNYDDVLIARIITNSSNVLTITNLANKARLAHTERALGVISPIGSGGQGMTANITVNWARAPTNYGIVGNVRATGVAPSGTMDGGAGYLTSRAVTRYTATGSVYSDWATSTTLTGLEAYIDFNMGA